MVLRFLYLHRMSSAKIVPCIEMELRPMRVTKCQPVEFDKPVKGRMFHSFDFGNIQQPPNHFRVKDLPVRREHCAELEGQDVRVSSTYLLIDRRLFSGRFSVHPAGLKQNRDSTAWPDRRPKVCGTKFTP